MTPLDLAAPGIDPDGRGRHVVVTDDGLHEDGRATVRELGVELVVAHNMEFDRNGLRWLGVFVPPSKQYCTMLNLVPESEKWPKLSEAVTELGIQVMTEDEWLALVGS